MKNKNIILFFAITLTAVLFINLTHSQDLPPIPGAIDYTIALRPGWNMISSPVSQTQEGSSFRTPTPADIKGCGNLTLWEYNPTENRYINPTILLPMKGYWVFSEASCNATIRGVRSDTQRTLAANSWEMISSRYSWNKINNSNSKCVLESPIYHYDQTKNDYIIISQDSNLDDTKSYWVFSKNTCTLNETPIISCPAIYFPTVEPAPGCRWEYDYDSNRCVIGRKQVCPPSDSSAFPPIGLGNVLVRNDFVSPAPNSEEWQLMTSQDPSKKIINESLFQLQYHNNIIYYPVYDLAKGQIRLYSFNTATQKWGFPLKTFSFSQRPESFRTLKENDNIYFVMIGGTSGGILKYNITQDKLENIDIKIVNGLKDLIQMEDLVSVYQDNIYLIRNETNNNIAVFKLDKSTGQFIKEHSDTISNSKLINTNFLMPTGNNVVNGEIIFTSADNSQRIIVSAYNIAHKRYYRVAEGSNIPRVSDYNRIFGEKPYLLKENNATFICKLSAVNQRSNPSSCFNTSTRSSFNYLSTFGVSGDKIYYIDGEMTSSAYYNYYNVYRTSGYKYTSMLSQNMTDVQSINLAGAQKYQYDNSYKGLLSTFIQPYCPVINKNMWCLRATVDNKLNHVIIGVED